MVVLLLATLSTGVALHVAHERTTYRERLGAVARRNARVAAALDARVSALQIALRDLGQGIRKGHHHLGELGPELRAVGSTLQVHTIAVVDPKGLVTDDMRLERHGRGMNVADRDYFRAQRSQARFFLAPPVTSRVDGRWTWPISYGVQDAAGRLLAVLVASIDLNYLRDVLEERPHRVETLLLNGAGTVLHASLNVRQRLALAPGAQIPMGSWSLALRGEASWGRGPDPFGRADMLCALHPVGERDLYMVTLLDPATVAAELSNSRRLAGLATVALLAGLVWVLLLQLRATRQLAQSEFLLRSALEASGHGFLVVDAKGSIEEVSPLAQELLRDEGLALLAQPLATVFPSLVDPGFLAGMKSASDRTQCLRCDGESFPTTLGVTPLPTHPPRYVLSFSDQTASRKLEERVRAAGHLRALGNLTGEVAHDFNNLLAIIQGSCDLLSLEDLDPTTRRRLEMIQRAGKRGTDMTAQLLAFSRRQNLRAEVHDLNALVRDAEGLLRQALPSKVELRFELHPDTPQVDIDSGQLERALLNLALNARDAMPTGGALSVQTSPVEVGEEELSEIQLSPGSYALLTLSDTGQGMEAAVQAQIFEPFFTTKREGTGLGLSSVYGFLRQSGGGIAVQSTPGQGTTFSLYLPSAGAPRQAPEPARAPEPIEP